VAFIPKVICQERAFWGNREKKFGNGFTFLVMGKKWGLSPPVFSQGLAEETGATW